ncbi:hypothetical protein PIB30_083166 [Stylosanthes scabra]|uniref:Uncharacterized protein n=1 Tax=Stylosanthes scabra TaxID=79078 RepID=A0ABU6TRR2_9FABA|nr:hypothetical protein [Stylosanthes scabra]
MTAPSPCQGVDPAWGNSPRPRLGHATAALAGGSPGVRKDFGHQVFGAVAGD